MVKKKKHQVSMFDFHYLTPPDSLDEWITKYPGLQVRETKCLHCDEIIKTTIPAFGKGWRGLVAPKCSNEHDGNFHTYVLSSDGEPCGFAKFLMS